MGVAVVVTGGTYGVAAVVGADVTMVGGVVPHLLAIAARVFGPTAPYPVVAGEPLDAIPCWACHCCTAFSVRAPKKPVAESDARRFWEMRNCWNCATSVPRKPRKRFRTRFGHEAEVAPPTGGAVGVVVCVWRAVSCAIKTCNCA